MSVLSQDGLQLEVGVSALGQPDVGPRLTLVQYGDVRVILLVQAFPKVVKTKGDAAKVTLRKVQYYSARNEKCQV